MASDFGELKREANMLDGSIGEKLQEFQKISRSVAKTELDELDIEAGEDPREAELAKEIEHQLTQLTETIDKMAECPETKKVIGGRVLQRFREVSFDYSQEWQKTSGSLQQKRNRASLFGDRKEDDEKSSEMDLLMKERNSIHKSQQMADGVIGQALAAREALNQQRNTFTSSSGKLGQLTASFSGVNALIGRIQKKKLKDNVVLAVVIALCICFLLYYFILP